MTFRRIRSTTLTLAASLALVACGGEATMTSENTNSQFAAAKVASPRAVVSVTLMDGGSPVAGATVEFSSSIAGRTQAYDWRGTTGSDGTADVEILNAGRRGASGYYLARAMDSSGNQIGAWGSIPVNGGLDTDITLPIGGRAEVGARSQIEDTPVFTVHVENISRANAFAKYGVFNTPSGASEPGPLVPGNAYEFEFTAAPGSRLSFATMFVPSNDFFYGPGPEGIALWEDGQQISGDITSQIMLWDAGSEVNQEPGTGSDQAQRQSGADTGAADPDGTVRLAPDTFSNLPAVSDVITVTVTPTSDTGFRVSIENVSTSTTLTTADGNTQMVPLAPGVFVVHGADPALFQTGVADAGTGLEALAEDGNPGPLAEHLASMSGVNVPFSPGVWVLHTTDGPLFTVGLADRGEGLEHIAEDGNVTDLASAVTADATLSGHGVFSVPAGASGARPAFSGEAFEFTFTASPGDRLSFATMFGTSSDWFFGPDAQGIPLFTGSGLPIQGNVSDEIYLWDAGTEITQEPGIGPDTGPNQSGPNTGAADPDETVRLVDEATWDLPPVSDLIKVTITVR